jgi:hypothetical protein
MSTCPRCKGHLTDSHRCPRRPLIVAVEIALWALAGGFAGIFLVAFFDPHNQISDLDLIAAMVGALAAVGLNRLLRS